MEGYVNASSTTNKFGEFCSLINQTLNCASESVFLECVPKTLEFLFENTNEYLKGFTYLTTNQDNNTMSNNTFECRLNIPNVAVQTGCQEEDVIKFLECEQLIDKFQFQPISFLHNSINLNNFCHVTGGTYKQCHSAMPCRFEPITSATQTLYSNICDRELTRRDQNRFTDCLNDVTSTTDGQLCLEPFHNVDLLGRDAGTKICGVIQEILNCTANMINEKCGDEALLHVYDTHIGWMHAFNASCLIHPPLHTTTTSILIEEPLLTAKIEEEANKTKTNSIVSTSTQKNLVLIIGQTEPTETTVNSTETTSGAQTIFVQPETSSKGIVKEAAIFTFLHYVLSFL